MPPLSTTETITEGMSLPPEDVASINHVLQLLNDPTTYELITDEVEANHVWLARNAAIPHVIKHPKRDWINHLGTDMPSLGVTTQFETQALCLINDHRADAPVEVPSIIHSDITLALSYIPGSVLGFEDIRNFTSQQQADLGRTLARFVVWLADTVSVDSYLSEMDSAIRPFDRRQEFDTLIFKVPLLDDIHQYTLASTVTTFYQTYRNLEAQGLIEPTIIGHEDLRSANWVFDTSGNTNTLRGVIDFGFVQPSTPERELRHLMYIGQTAVSAASQEFETLTGRPLYEPLIKFWADIQAILPAVYGCLDGFPYGYTAEKCRSLLECMWPDQDWGEITGDYAYVGNPQA